MKKIQDKSESNINENGQSQKNQYNINTNQTLREITKTDIDIISDSKIGQNKTGHEISYRSDIDGLRALAVILVIIFHAFPQLLKGGFVGVDVFFVISGYLITGILIKQKQFALLNFYNRRIRRIFPATLIVLISTFITACLIYSEEQLKFTVQIISASTYFSSNIELLYTERGYFDAGMETNPVLHLWSLGVEQQFYIIWPILIWISKKYFKGYMIMLPVLVTLISFFINENNAKDFISYDYYFPLCRFWEISIGAIISCANLNVINNILKNTLSIIGLIAILLSSYLLSQKNVYPGYLALIPTLGTAIIILSGQSSLVNDYILSNKLMIYLGKISFPLYLWHWPILVFMRYVYSNQQQGYLIQYSLILTFLLSVITFQGVQKNVRYNKRKIVLIVLVILMVLLGMISGYAKNHTDKFNLKKIESQDFEDINSSLQKVLQDMKDQENSVKNSSINNQNKDHVNQTVQNRTQGLIQNETVQNRTESPKQDQNKTSQNSNINANHTIRASNKTSNIIPTNNSNIQKNNPTYNTTLNLNKSITITKQQQTSINPNNTNTQKPIQKILDAKTYTNQDSQLNKAIQILMSPTPQDLLQTNGTKLPNSSVNKKRIQSTLVQIKFIALTRIKTLPILILPFITRQSKYWDNRFDKFMEYYVINQGSKDQLFIIGDSHAAVISIRFKQLFKDFKDGKTNMKSFPTVVILASGGIPPYKCHIFQDICLQIIKKHKPNRILYSYRWPYYWQSFRNDSSLNIRKKNCQYASTEANIWLARKPTSQIDVKMQFQIFKTTIAEFIGMGIQVYVSTINPEGDQWNPNSMETSNGTVINKEPIKLDQFKKKYQYFIQVIETGVKQVGGKIMDYSDHQCYMNLCQRFLPNGYPTYVDDNHFSSFYAAHWASSVNFLVQFPDPS